MNLNWRHVAKDIRPFTAYAFSRFLGDGGLGMAASLTYTTLLSLVPMMTVAFGMLAAFPVFEDMKGDLQNVVFSNLLPESAQVVRDYLDGFVQNTGKLTAAGTIGLGVTSILTLLTIEGTLNAVFRVKGHGPLGYRLLVFWALLTLGPLFMGFSLSLSTYVFGLAEGAGYGQVLKSSVVSYVLPAVITTVVLAFFFVIIPNRDVKVGPALVGAAVAAVLFGLLRYGFAIYITRFPTYQAIYGAVSAMPIFLLWIFCSWTVVLLGAVITAALSDWLRAGGRPRDAEYSGERKLTIALTVLRALLLHSRAGGGMDMGALMAASGLTNRVLEQALETLQARGYVARAGDGTCVLARDLQYVRLYDLFAELGLTLETTVAADEGGWKARLGERLAELRRLQKDVAAVSLRELMMDPEKGEPIVLDQSVPSRSRRTS